MGSCCECCNPHVVVKYLLLKVFNDVMGRGRARGQTRGDSPPGSSSVIGQPGSSTQHINVVPGASGSSTGNRRGRGLTCTRYQNIRYVI